MEKYRLLERHVDAFRVWQKLDPLQRMDIFNLENILAHGACWYELTEEEQDQIAKYIKENNIKP